MNPTTLAKRALLRAVFTDLVTTSAESPVSPSALVISSATSTVRGVEQADDGDGQQRDRKQRQERGERDRVRGHVAVGGE